MLHSSSERDDKQIWNNPTDMSITEAAWGGGTPGTGAVSLAAHAESWSRFSPCNPKGGSCWSRYPPCSPFRTSGCRRWKCPHGRWNPRRPHIITSPLWEGLVCGFLAGPVTPQKTHTGVIYSWRTVAHCKNPCWNRSWRIAACGKEAPSKGLSPMGGVPHWSRGEHEGEGLAEQIVFNVTPHPSLSLHHSGGRR